MNGLVIGLLNVEDGRLGEGIGERIGLDILYFEYGIIVSRFGCNC